MPLRDYVASLFARPKPDAREELNKAAFTQEQQRAAHEKAQQEQADRKTEADIVAKQAGLMQTHLTPERTPFGTQPKLPLTEKQARDLAEKRVVAKAGEPAKAKDTAEKNPFRLNDGKLGQEAGPTLRGEAGRGGFAATHGKDDGDGSGLKTEVKKEATQSKVDPRARLEGEEVTPAYIAKVVHLQAGHEVEGDEKRSGVSLEAAERDARIAARVAEIEAERTGAAYDHSHTHGDGGRTI